MSTVEEKINKAFDTNSANSTLVHLSLQEATSFIDYVVDESVILKQARVVRMDKPNLNIAKVGIGSKVLYPATHGTELDSSKRVKATTGSISLSTKELIGEVTIYDDELEDNIEGEKFMNHLLQMIAKQIAIQLEQTALYAKKASDVTTAVDINQLFDGWVTRALASGVVVDANSALFANRYIDRTKFTKLLKSVPSKYRATLDGLYVPSDIAVDYENNYSNDTTTQAGVALRNSFNGKTFIEVPLLSVGRPVAVDSAATTTMSAGAAAGAVLIPMTATAGFTVGKSVKITNADAAKTEYGTITAVVTNTSITIDTPLAYAQLNGSAVTEVTLDGADVLWTPKQNLIMGIERDITIEKYREPRLRATSFIITNRIDFQVENVEAIAVLTGLQSR